MSERVKSTRKGGGFQFKVRGPRDFYGGLALIALAIIAILATSDLPGQHGFAFGPGTAPRMFATMLAVIGALVSLTGLIFDGPKIEAFAIRGPAYVLAAILVFAALIRGVSPDCHRDSLDPAIVRTGAVHLRRLHHLDHGIERNALGGKPDRRRGDDRVLRRSVRLSAATAVPALALVVSRKHQHD